MRRRKVFRWTRKPVPWSLPPKKRWRSGKRTPEQSQREIAARRSDPVLKAMANAIRHMLGLDDLYPPAANGGGT